MGTRHGGQAGSDFPWQANGGPEPPPRNRPATRDERKGTDWGNDTIHLPPRRRWGEKQYYPPNYTNYTRRQERDLTERKDESTLPAVGETDASSAGGQLARDSRLGGDEYRSGGADRSPAYLVSMD